MSTSSFQLASSQRRKVVRSLAIVGLACTTVSLLQHARLHRHFLRTQDYNHKQQAVWAFLPNLFSGETQEIAEGRATAITSEEEPGKIESSTPDADKPRQNESPVEIVPDEVQQTRSRTEPLSVQSVEESSGYPNSTSPYAYGFVIGGCNPDKTPSYQNYLFNIAVAAKILRERGSTADVFALFQVSKDAKRKELPAEDLRILHSLGVYVFYIPQQKHGQQSFYRTQLDKFRILGMKQYKRVLFLDGDVMPVANLDYLFKMSVKGTLQENVVLQGIHEPANGGFFMLKPGPLQDMQDVITWRERTALELPYPYFDEVLGWGQVLTEDDKWVAKSKSGTNWTFLAAFADQGLLYYFTKYNQKSVSILMRNGNVQNWGEVEVQTNGTTSKKVGLIKELTDPFDGIDSKRLKSIPGRHKRFKLPTNSMVHFTGNKKPWMGGGPPTDCCHNATSCCNSDEIKYKSATHYWYWTLSRIAKELNLDINFAEHWKPKRGTNQRPPLGLYPVYKHVLNASSNILTPLQRVYPASQEEYRAII